jgi:putative hemolysin
VPRADMWGVELLVMAGMVAVNGVFAAYELALASVTLARLQVLADEKRGGAASAAYMKRNMEGSLAGVQLGITLVGAIAAAVGGAGAEEQLAPSIQNSLGVSSATAELLAIALVVAPLTAVTIVFGELIPKVFALRNKEWVCLRLSTPMRWFVSAVWPVVWGLESSVTGLMALGERVWRKRGGESKKSEATELQELRAGAAVARMSRLISPREERIIVGATALSTRPMREVMLPAEAISMLDANAEVADALARAHLDLHTRFPLTERPGDPQGIIGYVNFKDLVALMRLSPFSATLRAIARSIPSVRESTAVSACLEQMMRDHTHIALVRSTDGRVVGMATQEDILEELVGEIEDEYDHLPLHVVKTGAGWVVGGGIAPDKLREATGIDLTADLPPGEVRHLSDWVTGHLGHPVDGGEAIDRNGVRVVVRKVRRQKVLEAQVQRRDPPAGRA